MSSQRLLWAGPSGNKEASISGERGRRKQHFGQIIPVIYAGKGSSQVQPTKHILLCLRHHVPSLGSQVPCSPGQLRTGTYMRAQGYKTDIGGWLSTIGRVPHACTNFLPNINESTNVALMLSAAYHGARQRCCIPRNNNRSLGSPGRLIKLVVEAMEGNRVFPSEGPDG